MRNRRVRDKSPGITAAGGPGQSQDHCRAGAGGLLISPHHAILPFLAPKTHRAPGRSALSFLGPHELRCSVDRGTGGVKLLRGGHPDGWPVGFRRAAASFSFGGPLNLTLPYWLVGFAAGVFAMKLWAEFN